MEEILKYTIFAGALLINCFVIVCFTNYIRATYIHQVRRVKHYDSWFVCLLFFKFCENLILIYIFGINNNIFLYHTFFFMICKYSHGLYLIIFLLKTSNEIAFPKLQKSTITILIVSFLTLAVVSLTTFGFENNMIILQEPYIVNNIAEMISHTNIVYMTQAAVNAITVIGLLTLVLCIKNNNENSKIIIIFFIISNLVYVPILFLPLTSPLVIREVFEISYVALTCLMYFYLNKSIPCYEKGRENV